MSMPIYFTEKIDDIINNFSDTEIYHDSILIHKTVHFDFLHINVKKSDGYTGWNKKNTSKNDYSVTFKLFPIDDIYIDIEVFSYGLSAQVTLIYNKGTWKFINDSPYQTVYEKINFCESIKSPNQFTKFIVSTITDIINCLNNNISEYEDNTTYDSEPEDTPEIKGDLILTIRKDTINVLKHKGNIKLSDKRYVVIDETMMGKKIIYKDTGCFYPLNIKDFNDIAEDKILIM